jgi:hypothetical protein
MPISSPQSGADGDTDTQYRKPARLLLRRVALLRVMDNQPTGVIQVAAAPGGQPMSWVQYRARSNRERFWWQHGVLAVLVELPSAP